MKTAPHGKRGSWDFAPTSSTNISTCAGRREPAYGKRSIAMPSAKPCCTQPVTTQTVPGSSSRNYVASPEDGQGICTNFPSLRLWNVSVLFSQSEVSLDSVASARRRSIETVVCTGSSKGQTCNNRALPFSQHCFQRILLRHLWLHSWTPQTWRKQPISF